jgi:PKD repeat protein
MEPAVRAVAADEADEADEAATWSDPGVHKVTLTVDGKEVETKKMTVSPDPQSR